MKTNKNIEHMSDLISKLLGKITPIEESKTRNKMLIAARIEDLLVNRGWSKTELASKMGKRPSEITRWLSGTHNFTIETLCEIALVFEIKLVSLLGDNDYLKINKQEFFLIVPQGAKEHKVLNDLLDLTRFPLTNEPKQKGWSKSIKYPAQTISN